MGSSHSCGAFPHDVPSDSVTGARYFKAASTGILLHYRSWSPPNCAPARATVYVVHGYAEHLGRHEPFAVALSQAGFVVHALDLAGHGQSHGDRAFITSLDDIVADVLELCVRVAPPAAGSPAFLFGHSMGGLVALRVAQGATGARLFKGAVLSAPALNIDPAVDTTMNRWLARTLSNILPKLPVTPMDPRKLCTDARVVEAFLRDPLVYHGNVRVRTGAEIIHHIASAFADATTMTVPLFIVHGVADQVCQIGGSRKMAALLLSPKATLNEYPGAFHELLNEPNVAAQATRDIIEWLNVRVAQGGIISVL